MPNFRRLRRVTVLIVVLLAATSWWSGAQQSEEPLAARAGEAGALITDDVVTAGETIQINANVKGDVAAAGADVRIAGPIEGYVLGAGRHVRIDAPVGNDLWAAGETVDIDSSIANNAMVAARLVHLRPGAVVGEDAHLAGDQVTVEGRVERNLHVAADVVAIRGPVGGSITARAERVRIEPGAVIGGDLIVKSPRRPEVSPGAQVTGEIRYEEARRRFGWASWPAVWLLTFAALLVLALAATAVAPRRAARVSETLRLRPGRSLAIGALALLIVPLGVAALAVTFVGIPLALVALAMYLLFLLLSGVFVSHRVGGWLLDRAHRTGSSRWARVTIGVLVVSLAITVPLVGWVVGLAVVMVGTGALVLEERTLSVE